HVLLNVKQMRPGNREVLCSCAVFQDDKIVHNFLTLREITTGKEVLRFEIPGKTCNFAVFSSDGATLAAMTGAKGEKTTRLATWDVASGRLLKHIKLPIGSHPIPTEAVDRLLVLAAHDGEKAV